MAKPKNEGKPKGWVEALSRPAADTSNLPTLTGKDTGALAKDIAAGRETQAR